MQSTKAAYVCTDKEQLVDTIREMLSTPNKQRQYYEQQSVMTHEHHNIEKSCEMFMVVVNRALSK